MDRNEASFAQMMRDMAAVEGAALLREETVWRERVPDSTDRAAMAALGLAAGAAAAAPAKGTLARRAGGAGRRLGRLSALARPGLLKTALLALAAAAVLAAGACTAVPTLRETVAAWFSDAGTVASPAAEKQAGDYVVPSPGEGFELTDAAESERLVYRWYTRGRQEVLVQIARQLPADPLDGSAGEAVLIGCAPGVLHEDGERMSLSFRDGEVQLRVVFFGRERQELLDYAARLARANGIG